MVETIAEAAHLAIQLVFTRMGKRRMADVVTKRKSFGELFIEIQRGGHGAGDLRDLDGVGEPVTKVIRDARRKHLRFILQAAERGRMDDAVAIALELAAVRMRQFRISPASASFDGKTQAA